MIKNGITSKTVYIGTTPINMVYVGDKLIYGNSSSTPVEPQHTLYVEGTCDYTDDFTTKVNNATTVTAKVKDGKFTIAYDGEITRLYDFLKNKAKITSITNFTLTLLPNTFLNFALLDSNVYNSDYEGEMQVRHVDLSNIKYNDNCQFGLDSFLNRCYKLETVIIDGLKSKYNSIGNYFLQGCGLLKYISVKDVNEFIISTIRRSLQFNTRMDGNLIRPNRYYIKNSEGKYLYSPDNVQYNKYSFVDNPVEGHCEFMVKEGYDVNGSFYILKGNSDQGIGWLTVNQTNSVIGYNSSDTKLLWLDKETNHITYTDDYNYDRYFPDLDNISFEPIDGSDSYVLTPIDYYLWDKDSSVHLNTPYWKHRFKAKYSGTTFNITVTGIDSAPSSEQFLFTISTQSYDYLKPNVPDGFSFYLTTEKKIKMQANNKAELEFDISDKSYFTMTFTTGSNYTPWNGNDSWTYSLYPSSGYLYIGNTDTDKTPTGLYSLDIHRDTWD